MTNKQAYAGLLERLLESCIDWTGEPIVDGSTPRYELSCGDIREAAEAISSLLKRVEAVRNVIERGYRGCNKNDKCPHDRFGFEDCIACYDEALLAALNSDAPLSIGEGDRG